MSKLKLSNYKKPDAVISFSASPDAVAPIATSITRLFNDFQSLPSADIDIFCKILNFIFDTKSVSRSDIMEINQKSGDYYGNIISIKKLVSDFASENDVQQAQSSSYIYLSKNAIDCPLRTSFNKEMQIFLEENDIEADIESRFKSIWDEAFSEVEAEDSKSHYEKEEVDVVAEMFADAARDRPDTNANQPTVISAAAANPTTRRH